MEHTEGKLHYDYSVIRSDEGDMIADCQDYHRIICEGKQRANAKRLALCWNQHDDLKNKADLFDELVILLGIINARLNYAMSQDDSCDLQDKIEEVLAKAKKVK